jgi:ubiquinone/menaquinone biosynthesis C-methylase UbiE
MADTKRQKEIFLASEADAWYERNREALERQNLGQDPICRSVMELAPAANTWGTPMSILEVGCGEGLRLSWLAKELGAQVHGIEPSAKAVAAAQARGVDVKRGTADSLPFDDAHFDILLFGFCLYLCDPEDMFRVAAEADRVLKAPSWLVVHDFFASAHTRRPYHHKAGVMSNKMDFRKLFDWHPAYTCYSHRLSAHGLTEFSDDPQEWVSTSILRKQALAKT